VGRPCLTLYASVLCANGNSIGKTWLNDEPQQLHKTLHHPNGGAPHLVDETTLRQLIVAWQSDQRVELLDEILRLCEPIVKGSVFSRHAPIEPGSARSHIDRTPSIH
jgi:hypothetical protein